MNGRFVPVLGLMVVVAGFAGCLEAISMLSNSEGEVTAAQNRDLADAAASAWASDAQLVAVFAFEQTNMTPEFPSDPAIGNGKAPLWIYGYKGMNGSEARAFQVTADGAVQAMNDSSGMDVPDVGEAVSGWQIDSDKAVEIARANATFEAMASREGASMIEALGSEDGVTVWAIMAGAQDGQAVAIVDAMEGALIAVESFDMADMMPAFPTPGQMANRGPQLEMEDSGTVSPGSPMEYPFALEYADVGMLSISYDRLLPFEAVRVTILDADGEEVMSEVARGGFGPSGGTVMDIAFEKAGDYTLVLSYATMGPELPVASVDYQFYFAVGACLGDDADAECETSAASGGR